jgi:hypothetical protein
MNSLYFFFLIAALAMGTFHYRRQGRGDTGLPSGHPRRRRAQILFPFLLAFAVLAVFAWCFGVVGISGTVAFAGFGIWFVALFLVRKQIPKEADIRAYEEAHPVVFRSRQAPPRSETREPQAPPATKRQPIGSDPIEAAALARAEAAMGRILKPGE